MSLSLLRRRADMTPPVYVFSVTASRLVRFSPGNLQYRASTKVWRFAPHQYDYVGDDTNGTVYVGSTKSNNAKISSSYSGWIDLFGWGTSGYNKKYPYMTSTTNTDYGNGTGNLNSTNYDWGRYDSISNPKTGVTDPAGTWRIMTRAEWNYLMFERSGPTVNGTSNARYTKATLTTSDGKSVKGLILFPDNYQGAKPSGVTWGVINGNTETRTTCTASGWDALEKLGCVFLPICGFRKGTTVGGVTTTQQNYYWTATHSSTDKAYYLMCNKVEPAIFADPRHWGLGVRLVKTI